MHEAGWHWAPSRNPIVARSRHVAMAGLVATVLVILAVFGPPVTGQSIAPLLSLRHEILMMDREFERSSLRMSATSARTGAPVSADFGLVGPPNDRARMRVRRGVS